MSERIYTLTADSELDMRLQAFQEQLAPNERIVSTAVVGEKLIVTTRTVNEQQPNEEKVSGEARGSSGNLLFD